MLLYNGTIYPDRYALKKATGLSGCKIAAKMRDNEIIKINEIYHTGFITYEELYNNTEHNKQ